MGNEIKKVDIESSLRSLDELSKNIRVASMDLEKRFTHMFQVSQAVLQVRSVMTSEVVAQAIMPLMNLGALGFFADREYSIDVVATVMTEALLTDVSPCNNELGIIKGKLFRQKNHYRRKLREFSGLTDLRIFPGAVKMMQGGALVNIRATWKLDGKPFSMDCAGDEAIPVKLNEGMGQDGAIGKAERKIMTRIYNQVTGSDHTETEPDEEELKPVSGLDVTTPAAESPKPTSQTNAVKTALREKEKADAEAAAKVRTEATKTAAPQQASTAPAKTSTPAAPAQPAAPAAPAAQPATPAAPAQPAATAAAKAPTPQTERIETTISDAQRLKRRGSSDVAGYLILDEKNTRYFTDNLALAQMAKKAKEKKESVTLFFYKSPDRDELILADCAVTPSSDSDSEGDEIPEDTDSDDNGDGVPEDQGAPVESSL